MSNKSKSLYVAQSGVIAALYVALTYLSNALGLAFGPVQFRLSEALTILPVFTPAAVPGLAVGCLISNIVSPYGIIDMILGTLATLFAALLTRKLRNIRIKDFPVLSSFMPVLFNCVFIGCEIAYFLPKGTRLSGFALSFLQIGAGETVCCMILGLLLYKAFKSRNIKL